MKIATWNVNGARARQAQLLDFLERERPDVVCLQEIKASIEQLPPELTELPAYWSHWHGDKGYSGVALLVRRELLPGGAPAIVHPDFDFERRICTATIPTPAGDVTVASVYVPNGGKDFDAKLQFLDALDAWADDAHREEQALVLCGDLNVARHERDVHEQLRKPNQIGTTAVERGTFERLLSRDLVDIGRAKHPDDDALFTWWAPWRNMKEKNIGWRIDYVLASSRIAATCSSIVVQRELGTSDHGPVVAQLDL